jgi:long-chain acyl-CoA synthetase
VGQVLPGWELKIVDDDDRELPPGRVGEIAARGPMMSGYYQKPQETANVIRGGWLHTGDMGRFDKDGELFLTGIKKDMIIAKGQNIFPSDIETVLQSHPKVAEAAVLGVKDEMRGQIVRAVVKLRAGETVTEPEIKKYCLERLANYKVPKQVIFVDSLPRDAKGRIKKEGLC